jgi:hypothetical protein
LIAKEPKDKVLTLLFERGNVAIDLMYLLLLET